MPQKNLSNLIQEESTKLTLDSVIEIAAEAVLEPKEQINEISNSSINNHLHLEATIEELRQTISELRQKEFTLKQENSDLQIAVSEGEALAEHLRKELYATKQIALQLADSNSQLLEEIKVFKQPSQQSSQISKSIQYKKSHRTTERLQEKPTQDNEDFSANTWLYD